MEKCTVKRIIDSLNIDNPLRNCSNVEYREKLELLLLDINSVKEEKIKNLLCDNSKFDKFKYNEAIAELMLYFCLSSTRKAFIPEKNVNYSNNKNVDVSLDYSGITYNFEVKSPKYEENNKDKMFGSFAYRSGDKSENCAAMNAFVEQLRESASVLEMGDVVHKEMSDNKIKDCLLNAQEKFCDPSKTICNLLLISTTSLEMIHYWDYIMNEDSGF